jgi:hypothetical protein
MGTSKPHMAASIREIREIFMRDWDPIGVGNMNWTDNEYDAYIMPVYDILRRQRSEQAIVDYLRWAETERMEVDLPRDRLKAVAQKLLQIDVSQDEVQQ